MRGLMQEKDQYVHMKLLIMASELLVFSEKLDSCLSTISNKPETPQLSSFLETLTDFSKRSMQIGKSLSAWNESLVFKEIAGAPNLNAVTAVLINTIQLPNDGGGNLRNYVKPANGGRINLSLYGFVLYKLLSFVLRFSAGEELSITSCEVSDNIHICISGIKSATLTAMSNATLNSSNTSTKPDLTLQLCYDMLSLYGGNLWSAVATDTGGSIYFSIPLTKNI